MSSRDKPDKRPRRLRSYYRARGEPMPLRLPRMRSRKKMGRGEGDSESIASGGSDRTLEGSRSGGYVIAREKDLPKLHKAAWRGDLEKVKQVSKHMKRGGPDVNYQDKEKRTALHLACARGHSDVVNHLMSLKVSVTACDSDGCTPMHKALDSGHSECLPVLVESGGGDTNIADKHGRTPLHIAAMHGDTYSATVLLEGDALIDAIEKNGRTAVHIATVEGHKDFVASMINDGADVNATDGRGCTALMMAASEGHIGLLKLLMESKADPDVKDKDTYKAIDYAISRNHPECAHLIEDYEKVVAQEAFRQQPRRPSLVDASLISASFGLGPLPQDRKSDSKAEETLSHASESQQDWLPSDLEDEMDNKPTGSKMNLKIGLDKAKSASHMPEVVPPEVSDISLTKKKEEGVFSASDSPPPKESGETQHYQLSTLAAAHSTTSSKREGFQLMEEVASIGSELSDFDWDDSDEESVAPVVPKATPTDRAAEPATKMLGHVTQPHVTQPSDHVVIARDEVPQVSFERDFDSESEAKDDRKEVKVPSHVAEKLDVLQSPDQYRTEDFDTDSSLILDDDLPGFEGYNPSTPASVGRSEVIRLRATGVTPKLTPPQQPKSPAHEEGAIAATSPSVMTDSSPVAVTPLSGTFTADMWSLPRPQKEGGEIADELVAEAEKVEKMFSFSTMRESDGGKDATEGKDETDGKMEGKDQIEGDKGEEVYEDSDWDSEEEEEEELSEDEDEDSSALAQMSTGGGLKDPFMIFSKPRSPISSRHEAVYYTSDSEEETPAAQAVQLASQKKLPPLELASETDSTSWAPTIESQATDISSSIFSPRERAIPGQSSTVTLSESTSMPSITPMASQTSLTTVTADSDGEMRMEKAVLPRVREDFSPIQEEGESEAESEREQRQSPPAQVDSGLGTLSTQLQLDPEIPRLVPPQVSSPTSGHMDKVLISPPSDVAVSEECDLERIEELLKSSLDDGKTSDKTQEPQATAAEEMTDSSNLGVGAKSLGGRRKPRRETTAVTTAELQAAKLTMDMEEEASRRMYERDNEYKLFMESRKKWSEGTWVSPRSQPSDTEEALKSPVRGRVKLPSLKTGNPGMKTGNPGMETGNPGMKTGNPGMETGNPGMRTGNPGMKTGNPGMETGNPGMETGNPGMETGYPGMETGNPGMENGNPGMETGYPGMKTGYPGMETGYPGMKTGYPGMENGNPGMENGNPGMENGNPGMETQPAGIPEGKSRVQLMKEMWESGAVFGREEKLASEQEPLRRSSKGNISQRWIEEISRSRETTPERRTPSPLNPEILHSIEGRVKDEGLPAVKIPSVSFAAELEDEKPGSVSYQLDFEEETLSDSGSEGDQDDDQTFERLTEGTRGTEEGLLEQPLIVERPLQDGLLSKQPSQDGLLTEQPSQGGLLTEQPSQDGLLTEQPSQGGLLTEQPLQDGLLTEQPLQDGLLTEQPSQDGLLTEQPSQDGLLTEQPSQDGLLTEQPSQDGLLTEQPSQDGLLTEQPSQDGLLTEQDGLLTEQDGTLQEEELAGAREIQTRFPQTPKAAWTSTPQHKPSEDVQLTATSLVVRSGVPLMSSVEHMYSETTSAESSMECLSHSYVPCFHSTVLRTPLHRSGATAALTLSQLDSSNLKLHHLDLETEGQKNDQKPSNVESGRTTPDALSESHDMLSDVEQPDDLQFSHMDQSGAGMGSAHMVHLTESLREARRGLERSLDARQKGERVRRQLQAQLEDSHRKYDEMFGSKVQLENSKLELELQLRELRYHVDQQREGQRSSEVMGVQLKEQLEKIETRLGREVAARQQAELSRKELEMTERSLQITNQQLQDQLTDLANQLQSERDTRLVQEGLYKEQMRMFQNLQEESKKVQDQKVEVLSQLQAADTRRQGLEEKLTELQIRNTQLEADLVVEKRCGEDHVTRLETEVETLKEQLQEKTEKQAMAEDALLESKQQFELTLSELSSKTELLSSGLDQEAALRKGAQNEVLSLQSRLDQVNGEFHELQRQLEEARRDKAVTERDLSTARENGQHLSAKIESLEQRLAGAENEVKSHQTLVMERANQISALQREVDHRQLQLQASEDALKREKDQLSKLESQLSSMCERLSATQSEAGELRRQLEEARRTGGEKEANSLQQQERFNTLFNSLRADYEKDKTSLEDRHQSLTDQLVSLREELARKETEMAGTGREMTRLQEELSTLQQSQSDLEGTLQATEEAYHELEEEKGEVEQTVVELSERVSVLEGSLSVIEQEKGTLQENLSVMKRMLTEAKEAITAAHEDRGNMTENKHQLETEVTALRGRIATLQAELQNGSAKEEQLRGQVEHLSQIRTDLEQVASKLQGDVTGLQLELSESRNAHSQAERVAEEARGLWETEVKSRSKLGLKMMEMEKSQSDISAHVAVEKRRTHKALELKRTAELKCESLHERISQLQQELVTTRTHLKTTRKRVREMELEGSQIPSLRAEFDLEQVSLQTEVSQLRRQLESTQDQLRKESELRMKLAQEASEAKLELEASATKMVMGQSDVHAKKKEIHKLDRANRKLKEELKGLQAHIATNMVDKSEMELYRKAMDEKARLDLSRKLEEVNAHLEQQSQAQEALQRLRSTSETELKQRYERNSEGLRMQLSQSFSDRQNMAAEAKRFKELYEAELRRSEKMFEKLQKAKEDAQQSKTRLSLERNRTQHLLSATQNTAASLTATHSRHFSTSTPLKLGVGDPSSTDDLLSSVRLELDRSIARHLDSVPTRDSGALRATRSTYRTTSDSVLLPSKFSAQRHSHLDAIKRNYHV